MVMDLNVFLLYTLSIFIGVVAGTFVNALTQAFFEWRKRKELLRNLKFEVEMNIKKLDKWLESVLNYRNAVNSETLFRFFDYFDFSKFISVTFFNMFNSGILYKYLNHQEIAELQIIIGELSSGGENYMFN